MSAGEATGSAKDAVGTTPLSSAEPTRNTRGGVSVASLVLVLKKTCRPRDEPTTQFVASRSTFSVPGRCNKNTRCISRC